MKFYNIFVDDNVHLAVESDGALRDLTAAGFPYSMKEIVSGCGQTELQQLLKAQLPAVEVVKTANVMDPVGKLLCVGLNYKKHTEGIQMKVPDYPNLFCKFSDALAPAGADVTLPPWETTYDYEAELVIVIGKNAWNIREDEAEDYIFGYTCGNDFSCRDAQMRTGQWLIGKTMPGFGPCGPCIVTKDEIDPQKGVSIQSYVNGELRQDGTSADMIFDCRKIVSYASHYVPLSAGDLIFTGTPSGVALEGTEKKWLVPGDVIDVKIEGIGCLTNRMV